MSVALSECSINDFVVAGEADIKTGPFGTQLKAAEYVSSGTPVINVRNIGFGGIREEKLEFIDPETTKRLSSHLLEDQDIVFGRKGAVERHVFIQQEQSGWMQGSDCIRLRIKSEKVIPRYLSYYFLTDAHQKYMMANCSHGATMPSLNQDIIQRIALKLPDIDTQKSVVEVLSAYDSLIENNNRRIAILENMAQSLYREWFVNFHFPGHENCKFVDSALGRVPEGWAYRKLSEVSDINKKQINSKKPPESIGYIDIASVSQGSIDLITQYQFSDAPGRARRIVGHGDILWSCVRPNRRSYALVMSPEENSVASTGFAVITAKTLPFSYLYFAVTTDSFVGYLVNSATGSAYPAVTAKDFEAADVLSPSDAILDQFNFVVLPVLMQCNTMRLKNENLKSQRDMLLPRLVSGELEIKG